MLAGIVFGPNTPGLDLVSDPDELELVARLGLVFLLFYLGLEFSLDHLVAGGRRLVSAASIYLVLNVGGGLVFGLALGWGTAEAFVLAGVVGISSSAIVTKLLVETRRLGNRETRTILGIAVIEDIFLAFYLALLQPVLGGADGLAEALVGIATAFLFLCCLAGSPATARPLVGPAGRHQRRGDRRHRLRRPGDHHRRRGRGARGVRRHRRVHGRADPRCHREGGPAAHPHPPAA